ncbi:phage protein Gp27 family protein [Acidovorax sp. SUPP3334]|uniref:phage protein Gp27 family protein n=1 Tax=Acidovorax sp. SUPP3334 TaxID=2920881 RepID=UPI0023DE49A5|nr:phage protein Gp27 family protein [Acidovorax sp. SUPP3334]GKT21673.1 DUF3486 family protein [Acidovorax sp. SUPP3334]
MGRKSTVSRLPADIKTYIEAMIATGAQTLDEMIRDLQARFPAEAQAGQLPSRTALHRYGSKLDRRLAAIRASTEAAKIIQAQAGDDKDARSEALTALIQTELFEAILDIQEAGGDPENPMDPAERVSMLSAAAKNIATLTRSSVNLKKFQADEEARIAKAAREQQLVEQQDRLQELRGADGLSEQMEVRIRRILLGKE